MDDPKYDVDVELVGQDGNAGAIMARVVDALKREGAPTEEIALFRQECMSGDYDNLLRTCMRWVNVS